VDSDLAFRVLNAIVMPWWLLWLIAPRSRWARRAASHGGVSVVLCGVYSVLIAWAIGSGGADGGLDFESVRAALSTPVGFLAGWTHYLVFDLFVGAWILRESGRLEVEPRPFLVFELMLGPIGLGAFLLRRAGRLRSLGQIGDADLA
jgi:hypothetical protein